MESNIGKQRKGEKEQRKSITKKRMMQELSKVRHE